MATLSIPTEYQDQLEIVEVTDTRTDEEILHAISQHAPVTSEKNIWAFWDSGLRNMPGWCQRNVVDWVRICGGWTVRILDNVPDSPNYALKYLSPGLLPEAFVERKMDGPYTGPHSADFLRGACLYEHGGAYMDVGSILFRHMDRICWDQIEDPNSPIQIAVPLMYKQTIANHFVAARKGDPFIKRWHDLFTYLWKNHTNHEGLLDSPLVAFGAELSFDESRASNFTWDFKVDAKTVMEYITQVICWTRLTMLEDAGDGFSCTDYWQKHVLCIDVLQENWGAEAVVGFANGGQGIFELLSMERNGDSSSEKYKQAEELVWRMLTRSSMQKITHGKGLTNTVALGVLWDMKENEGKDRQPGTFAELMRYGSVHFRQKRESIVTMEAEKPPKTMKKGLLEA
ncbi:Capsule polysaccharide biosynthesis [Mycena venus]|uniref:Capsule polysaccharide biosynthesis n=1 Tax=Mycena venus TaxID=2733690 RepID=A0A8H7CTK6_9AGAR|nr:Capsule polysaccharide biosynthesis [Mycena venus]